MPRRANQMDAYIGARIVELRLARGLSQTDLGKSLGISFQQIQKYESGANRVAATRLHQIALTLKVPFGQFFPDTEAVVVPDARTQAATVALMGASLEGRAVAADFPLIRDRSVRRAIAGLVQVLASNPA